MSTSRRAGVVATVVLAAGAVLLGAAAVGQAVGLAGARASAGPAMALRTAGRPEAPGRSGQPLLEQYDRVFERGHFGREPKPDKPRLVGVLGAVAFLRGGSDEVQAYAAGAELPGGFVLSEIQADAVVIEREGETERLTVFPRMDDRSYRAPRRPDGPRGRPARARPGGRPPAREPEVPSDSEMVVVPSSVEMARRAQAEALLHVPPEVREQIERQMREMQVGGWEPASPRAGDEE